MYRVLIIDDESFVVDWISDILEAQTELEYDIYRAYSASEALSWLNRAKIDILITDIRMPNMSGIELAEKVRINWPQCKILMLTAYAQFDYAYEAIKNNVVSYILKDESDEYILAEVKKAAALLDNELKNKKLLEDTYEQLSESTAAVQNDLLLGLLQNDRMEHREIFSQLESIGIKLNADKPFLLFIGRLDFTGPEPNIVEKARQSAAVKRIVRRYMSGHFRCFATEKGKNRLVWLMQSDGEKAGDTAAVIAGGALETIQQTCNETMGLNISFVIHRDLLTASQLPEAMQSIEEILVMQLGEYPASIVTSSVPEKLTSFDTAVAKRLTDSLSIGKLEDFRMFLEASCKQLEHCTSWHDNTALELYYATAVAFVAYINQRKLAERLAFKIGLNSLFRPYDTGSWKNAADYLRQLFGAIADLLQESEEQLSCNIIRALMDYIDGHIPGDVSLVRLSEVTGYNATYLSHLFRERTGITLKDYISRKRLSKIEVLMADARLNINDIASGAGFASRTYFNNFLRRMVGMSPQEYRLHLRQAQNK